MTSDTYRSLFPYLRTGRIYLDHASTAPLSTYVIENIRAQLEFRSRGKIELYKRNLEMFDETRAMVSSMLRCSPDRIAFTLNTSDGLNILAGGINWKTGDRILLNDIEFPANVYPFLNQKRHGVEIDFIKSKNDAVTIEDIEHAITPRTRLLSISWVQFLSGYKINLSELSGLCKKHNIILCVDAIQGMGAQQLDLSTTDVDFLSCGAQKWLLAPQGVAFIYISDELQNQIIQENVGWLSVKNAWDFFDYNLDLLDSAQRYEGATKNTLGIDAFRGSLTLFHEVGFDMIERCVARNATHAYTLLAERGFSLITPPLESERAGIVTFKHNRSQEIQEYLFEQNIHVSHRIGCIRLSPHFYNTNSEIAMVINLISSFLEE